MQYLLAEGGGDPAASQSAVVKAVLPNGTYEVHFADDQVDCNTIVLASEIVRVERRRRGRAKAVSQRETLAAEEREMFFRRNIGPPTKQAAGPQAAGQDYWLQPKFGYALSDLQRWEARAKTTLEELRQQKLQLAAEKRKQTQRSSARSKAAGWQSNAAASRYSDTMATGRQFAAGVETRTRLGGRGDRDGDTSETDSSVASEQDSGGEGGDDESDEDQSDDGTDESDSSGSEGGDEYGGASGDGWAGLTSPPSSTTSATPFASHRHHR